MADQRDAAAVFKSVNNTVNSMYTTIKRS